MEFAFSDPDGSSLTLAPSQYAFHPITEVTTQESSFCGTFKVNLEEDSTEVTYSASFGNDDDDYSLDLDALTPYPAYTKTSEEIRERKELELSLGENWSSKLAGELSSCDMSVDETIETEFEDDDAFGIVDIAEESYADWCSTEAPKQDDDEIRRKRNLLWKQSLKSSMFTQRR